MKRILAFFFLSCMIFSMSEARTIHRRTTSTKSTSTVTTATTTPSPCANITCLNDGVCVVLGNTWVCACRDGYVGENCETYYLSLLTTKADEPKIEEQEEADVIEEEEEEEFVNEEEDESLKFDPSPCFGITCPNGDECFVFEGKGFCPIESIVPQLNNNNNNSTDIGEESWECEKNPCENNQPCMKLGGKDTCFCTSNFEAPFCTLPPEKSTTKPTKGPKPSAKECETSNPCLNDQRCLEINNEPICFCTGIFKPPFCSLD